MGPRAAAEVASFARRFPFEAIDVTGGAPELVPGIGRLVESLAPLAPRLLFRTNLTALLLPGGEELVPLLRRVGAEVVASVPALDAPRGDRFRGEGTMGKCVASLRRLNAAGFGTPGSPLVLDLVSNPPGPFLPPGQEGLEEEYRRSLGEAGVSFSRLHVFANAPLGRFREWLDRSGEGERYRLLLEESFNPGAVEGLMCRSLLSVDWNGALWDCDFHLAAGIPYSGGSVRAADLDALPPEGREIAVADHCFACTAGAGFT
jgi:radical SAM/Cys-rich protein